MSYESFWRKNLGFAKLAVLSNLEYRVNFAVDAIVQPCITALIEAALWIVVFRGIEGDTLAGFPRESYLLYAIWASFLARISSNWLYEHRMVDEIDSGSVNAYLVRPVTFFEAYWSQFLSYKLLTIIISLPVPAAVHWYLGMGFSLKRFAGALLLVLVYLFFLHCISFFIASLAFFFNRVYSLTAAKNFLFWLLSGELVPVDLVPEPWREVLLWLPFSAGVYAPAGYLTGRVGEEAVVRGLWSIFAGIVVAGIAANVLWRKGLRSYAGTGA